MRLRRSRIDATHKLGEALEEGVVEVGQPRAHLVLRLGRVASDLVRPPRRLDRAGHGREDLRALVPGETARLKVEQALAALSAPVLASDGTQPRDGFSIIELAENDFEMRISAAEAGAVGRI